ncbi:MAG: acyltransferase [Lysobacter sp.]|nr:acyltransferase [Lysobacter sp.]
MHHHNNFDGLRLLGAATVLISHQFAVLGLAEPHLAGISLGRWGVMLFFAISGYLIARSWERDPHLLRFALRRFLRVAPALVVLQLLTAAALYGLGIQNFKDNPLPAVNGSLWTIALEIDCYLLFALLAMTTRKTGLLMIGLLLIAWATGTFAKLPWIDGQLATFGIAFGFGVLLHERPRLLRPVPTLLMLALGALVWRLSQPSFGIALIAAVLSIQIGVRAWPVWQHAGRYGDLSYGLYLYAFPVQQLLVLALGAQRPYLAMLALTATVTLPLAWLSWHCVERPALRLKPALAPRPAAQAEAATSA